MTNLLSQLTGTMHLIVMLLYGAGLRLEECLELRIPEGPTDRRCGSKLCA